MITLRRPVRFEEVDAAGILFFARYGAYSHEAMERVFDGLPGGYVDMITRRGIGFPAVATACEFRAPLRYGDVVLLDTFVDRIGNRSVEFRYEYRRERDDVHCATMRHTVVIADLAAMKSCDMPSDVRALLERLRDEDAG